MIEQLKNISVQDLIDRLMKVENKSQPLDIEVYGGYGFNLDYEYAEIVELVTTDGKDSRVEIGVFLPEQD